MRIWAYTYDDRVAALIESGVATIAAIRAELDIPGGTMKQIMTRLVKQGRIKVVRRGWYRAAKVSR
jgi:predicted transcriptional regulator of viral defense system